MLPKHMDRGYGTVCRNSMLVRRKVPPVQHKDPMCGREPNLNRGDPLSLTSGSQWLVTTAVVLDRNKTRRCVVMPVACR